MLSRLSGLWLCFLFHVICTRSSSRNTFPPLDEISYGEKYAKGSYRFVKGSNVCETTPGVKTISGYIEIGENMSMFFWFFEARNDPETAPFALWLNGGPGCSSMIGLFQENGPCKISSDGLTSNLNPYSWNEHAHMLYLDQPIGTGFSYGVDKVSTTSQAASYLWTFFQVLFGTQTFAHYQSQKFNIFTESYGGHYGPTTAAYFELHNRLIQEGKEDGRPIHLSALGIVNGWFDPAIQYEAYHDFALKKYNKHFDLVDPTTLKRVYEALHGEHGCLAQLKECRDTGKDAVCSAADEYCDKMVSRHALGDRNPYYILGNTSDTFPSESYTKFITKPEIMRAIGAEAQYQECPDAPFTKFTATGDGARSTLPDLAKALNAGLRTIIMAGAEDFTCNTLGGLRAMEAMQWKHQKEFINAEFKQLVIKGKIYGIYKIAGPLTYITIFDAGHEVPAYQPMVALEIFRQSVFQEPIHSVK